MFLYCVRFKNYGTKVKIGYTKDVFSRMSALEHFHGAAVDLHVWDVGANIRTMERRIHACMEDFHSPVSGDGGTEFFEIGDTDFYDFVSKITELLEEDELNIWFKDFSAKEITPAPENLLKLLTKMEMGGGVSAVEKLMLLTIVAHADSNGSGKAVMSLTYLTRCLGVTRPTVVKAIENLKNLRMICVSTSTANRKNMFQVNLEAISQKNLTKPIASSAEKQYSVGQETPDSIPY